MSFVLKIFVIIILLKSYNSRVIAQELQLSILLLTSVFYIGAQLYSWCGRCYFSACMVRLRFSRFGPHLGRRSGGESGFSVRIVDARGARPQQECYLASRSANEAFKAISSASAAVFIGSNARRKFEARQASSICQFPSEEQAFERWMVCANHRMYLRKFGRRLKN